MSVILSELEAWSSWMYGYHECECESEYGYDWVWLLY